MKLGPNEALIGAAGFERELATPALLLDLDVFEANFEDHGGTRHLSSAIS